MNFRYANLNTCSDATGLVIIVDVIRAFTTAAFVFSRGAEKIIPVSEAEDALHLKGQIPNALACGEISGVPPEGFDFGNSPTQILHRDLSGRTIVQRTSAGTQGVVRSSRAEKMVAASFVVAAATARYVQSLAPETVTFVITGQAFAGGGDEDLACAEYLEYLSCGQTPDIQPYLERVRKSGDAKMFHDPASLHFPESDISHCTSVDRFNFAMPIVKENGRHIMRAIPT